MRRTVQDTMVRSVAARNALRKDAVAGHFLLRTNHPRRRSGIPSAVFVQRRGFFGLGEIVGVITNVRRHYVHWLSLLMTKPCTAGRDSALLDRVKTTARGGKTRD
jgi:hypothetical protein